MLDCLSKIASDIIKPDVTHAFIIQNVVYFHWIDQFISIFRTGFIPFWQTLTYRTDCIMVNFKRQCAFRRIISPLPTASQIFPPITLPSFADRSSRRGYAPAGEYKSLPVKQTFLVKPKTATNLVKQKNV